MPRLLILREDAVERQLDLTDRDLRIGRGKENDIVLDDPSKGASRMHAELRYENGAYVVIDLNSQNGTWMQGQRVQRAALQPGVPITIGPFTLMLEGAPAAPARDTMIGRGAEPAVSLAAPAWEGPSLQASASPAARPSDTLVGKAAAAPPAAAAASQPVKQPRAPRPGQPPAQPGLIAAIARMPKPVIFAAFAVIVILIMVMGQLLAPSDGTAPVTASKAQSVEETRPAGRANIDIIAEHLAAGNRMMQSDPEAAIEELDRVLLIDPNHPEALDLRARAEERIQQLTVAAAPASTVPGPASTIPGGTARVDAAPQPSVAPPPPAGPVSTAPAGSAKSTATTIPPPTAVTPARGAPARGGRGANDPTMVARRPKETEAAWRARSKAVLTRYQNARDALNRGDFAAAVSGFQAILGEAAYQDSEALLAEATEGQLAAGRQAGKQAFDAAIAADVAGNWAAALQQFERARQLDGALAAQAEDGMRRTRDKMRAAGNEAFKRARQYDALGRQADAIAQYDQAAAMLPPDDPNAKIAKDRLDALRGGK